MRNEICLTLSISLKPLGHSSSTNYLRIWFHIRKEFLVVIANPKTIMLVGALLQ